MLNVNALIVLAHGSRDAAWRAPIETLGQKIQTRWPEGRVACAYLEWCEPDFLQACEQLAQEADSQTIAVLPLFFGMGRHARQDIPLLLQQAQTRHPQLQFRLLPSAGEMDAALEALSSAVLQHINPHRP